MDSRSVQVKWMFHATAMVGDYDATLEPLARLFGFRVLHDTVNTEPGIGRRGGMTWVGDGSLEIGEPAGTGSPVQRFVEDFGGGMHSVAIQVDDIDAARSHLDAHGARIANEPYHGMLWTHPKDTEGLLLEWFSLEQDDDPRWGAPPPDGPDPVVEVDRLAFVTAEVEDPSHAAARLGELMGTGFVALDGPGDIEAAVPLGDCTLALVPRTGRRARVHGMGLLVRSLDDATHALTEHGVEVDRSRQGLARVSDDAVPVPVFLCDALLPGDPRVA